MDKNRFFLMTRKSFSTRKLLRDLDKYSKLMTEAYIYDENEYGMDDERECTEDDGMGEQDLSSQDDRIAQIREVALSGLQEYAENVDSEMYQFYKKIWLMCDKAVSEKDSVAGNKGMSE